MTLSRPTTRHCGSSSATPPAAIWTAPGLRSNPVNDQPTDRSAVLPAWSVDRIRSEFARPQDSGPSLPLLRLAIPDARPGMDARTSCTATGPTGLARRAVILAELHPDALPVAPADPHPDATRADDWPGFFHRTHRLLDQGGFLLTAARQQRENGRLADPLGLLVACARMAGFSYLQHIVVVHGHIDGDRIAPALPPRMPPGLIHSDLLVFAP